MTKDASPGQSPTPGGYPATPAARDRWVVSHRSPRNVLDPWTPYHFLVEPEAGPDGVPVDIATIFLTNRECPWRCVMCDLWRNTLEETLPDGAIPAQIQYALDRMPGLVPARTHLKLYNAGSFFDPRAIPPADYAAIARLATPFARLIVECHPSLVGRRCLGFRNLIPGHLEIAMGLETAHPEVLERLNKRMTVDRFRESAEFLRRESIAFRTFILVRPPWLSEDEGLEWAKRSLDLAFDCGSTACALIPVRGGNGAMEALAQLDEFAPPRLQSVEAALDYGLSLRAGRVFVDLWDIDTLPAPACCATARIERLRRINLCQRPEAPVDCPCCASASVTR